MTTPSDRLAGMHATREKLDRLLYGEGWEDRFRAWLERQGPDAVVGVAVDADHCPLAKYLNAEVGGGLYVSVTYSDARARTEAERNSLRAPGSYPTVAVRLSDVARRFVDIVDETFDLDGEGDQEVTAAEAIAALEKARMGTADH